MTRALPGRRCMTVGGRLATSIAVVLAAAPVASARPHRGALDTRFAHRGIATLPRGTQLLGVALEHGAVVVTGRSGVGSNSRLVLARLTASGALDRHFGRHGMVIGPPVRTARGTGSLGRAVAVQSDGKIVVVGKATSRDGSARAGLLIERYDRTGGLDTRFGSHGVVNLLSASFGDGYALALLSGGRIVAAGSSNTPGSGGGNYPRAAIVRLRGNGQPDPSFGTGGIDQLDLGPYSAVLGVAAARGGRLALAGSTSPTLQTTSALVAELTASGALDRGFAGRGFVTHQYASGAAFSVFSAVAVQPDGKIVLAGSATGAGRTADMLAARFSTSGHPDGSFGSGGAVLVRSATNWTESGNIVPGGSALALTRRNVFVAGQAANSVLTTGTVWALSSRGQLDRSFGSRGVAAVPGKPGSNGGTLAAVAATSGGGAVAAGEIGALGSAISGLAIRLL